MGNKATTAPGLKRTAVLLCALALLCSALPLYAISFYNHPYYDDFNFSVAVHDAWQETGSLTAVLRAAWQSAKNVRAEWQGTYLGTLLSNVQPGVFSENLYFIGAFLLLTAFLACFWCFFATVFGRRGLGLSGRETAVLACLALALMLQCMPDAGEAFYWFNGGIGNLFVYSLLALAAALFLRLAQARGGKALALTAALALLMVMLGGGSYGGGLFGLCALALATLWLFVGRQPMKWRFLGLWLLFLLCFVYSMAAPGNRVRSGMIGGGVSPVKAVAQALYYGVALMGSYLRLPLVGVTVLALPFFLEAAKKSPWRFAHPWLALLLGGGVYCAQLVPPLYSGVFIGGPRTINAYWVSFVALWLLYAYYLVGWAVRRREAAKGTNAVEPTPTGHGVCLRRGAAALGVCLALVGCLGYKQPDDRLYGLQNLTGFSAAISLYNGEAAQYDREMDAREALLNDQSQPCVTLSPLTAAPKVFMDDLLKPGALYDVRPALCAYYHKTAVTVAGEGAEP